MTGSMAKPSQTLGTLGGTRQSADMATGLLHQAGHPHADIAAADDQNILQIFHVHWMS